MADKKGGPADDPRLSNPSAAVLNKWLAAMADHYDVPYWTPESLAELARLCLAGEKIARDLR